MPDHSISTHRGSPISGAAEIWPEIDCALIEESRRAVPPCPLDLLPLPWRSWVSETARSAGAPVDYAVQALLAGVAGLCGAGVLVRITPAWSEPLVLWQALVGRPSSGKSPALASMRSLLGTLEAEPSGSEGEERPRIVLTDPALEALAHAVRANPRGVILWRDAPTAWLAELGPSWLEGWAAGALDGEGTLSRKKVELAKFPVSVLGTIRPEHLAAAVGKADAAVAARFLYTWPDPPPHIALSERRSANNDIALDLLRRIRRVARRPLNPLALAFDAEATKAFDGFLSALHRDLGHAEGLEADWMGKGSGTVARLAGILELLAWGCDSGIPPKHVGNPSVAAAIGLWRDYFRPHATFVFTRGGPDDDLLGQARRVVRWLRAGHRDEITREDVRCHALYRAVNAGRADLVIGRLTAGGILRSLPPQGARPVGRPAQRWQVNPAVLS
jgi:hypothetical protein